MRLHLEEVRKATKKEIKGKKTQVKHNEAGERCERVKEHPHSRPLQ